MAARIATATIVAVKRCPIGLKTPVSPWDDQLFLRPVLNLYALRKSRQTFCLTTLPAVSQLANS